MINNNSISMSKKLSTLRSCLSSIDKGIKMKAIRQALKKHIA